MIRVVGRPMDPGTHLENRVGEPAANPYLYLASNVVAGLDGIDRRIDPGEPSTDPYAETDREPLPRSLMDAVAALRKDELFRAKMGDDFVNYILKLKQFEIDRFSLVRDRLGTPRVLRNVLSTRRDEPGPRAYLIRETGRAIEAPSDRAPLSSEACPPWFHERRSCGSGRSSMVSRSRTLASYIEQSSSCDRGSIGGFAPASSETSFDRSTIRESAEFRIGEHAQQTHPREPADKFATRYRIGIVCDGSIDPLNCAIPTSRTPYLLKYRHRERTKSSNSRIFTRDLPKVCR